MRALQKLLTLVSSRKHTVQEIVAWCFFFEPTNRVTPMPYFYHLSDHELRRIFTPMFGDVVPSAVTEVKYKKTLLVE